MQFKCEFCQTLLEVADEEIGKEVTCGGCRRVVIFPEVGEAPEPPAEAEPPAKKKSGFGKWWSPFNTGTPKPPPIHFYCWQCKSPLTHNLEFIGRDIMCPICFFHLKVPSRNVNPRTNVVVVDGLFGSVFWALILFAIVSGIVGGMFAACISAGR